MASQGHDAVNEFKAELSAEFFIQFAYNESMPASYNPF